MAEDKIIRKAEKALMLKDPEKIKAGLRNLGADFSPPALAVYLKAFKHKLWMIRELACSLVSSGGEAVIPFFEEQMGNLTSDQAYWVIKVLERMNDQAVPLLVRFLDSGDKDVRREAIRVLGTKNSPEILNHLIRRLDDPVWINRREASKVLESKAGKLPVLEAIQAALQKGGENTTFWVLRIMSRLIGSDPNNPIHNFLKHPNIRVRCAALSAMGNMVDEASVPVLISHLNDPSWIVRKAAADALQERGGQVETFLKAAFKEGSHDMKFWAIRLMAKLTGKAKLATYQGFLRGQVEELKYYGMQALSEIREKESAKLLIDCFRDRSWNIRSFASEQLVHIGSIAVSQLLNNVSSEDDDVKFWCIKTLYNMGEISSGALVNLISSGDKGTRTYVLSVLHPPLLPEFQHALVATLDDPEPVLQKKAADLLHAQGPMVARFLVKELFGDNENKKYWARKIVSRLGNQNLDQLLDRLEEDEILREKAGNYFRAVPPVELSVTLYGRFEDLVNAISTYTDASSGDPFSMSGVMDPKIKGIFIPGTGKFGETSSIHVPADFNAMLEASASGGGHELDVFLRLLHKKEGSDLHMNVGSKPVIRIHGELIALEEYPAITKAYNERVLTAPLTEDQRRKLEKDWALDCSYQIEDIARFRVNLFRQRRGLNGVYRIIPTRIPSFEQLRIPDIFAKFCELKQGIVLITGPTGSGKSSTLASMIDRINDTRSEHIITVEDPIEFVHNHKKCLISQREVGMDCRSFADALRSALREDPDVILVGEMRDLETIALAITAAETGHLVFGTLHTSSAGQTVDRIIDAYPPHQQGQVRVQLSNSIQAIVAQRLLPLADGSGRIPAHEILIRTTGIANLIREGKSEQLFSMLQTGGELGMQTFDDSLAKLVRKRLVRYKDAVEFAHDRRTFEEELGAGYNRESHDMMSGGVPDLGQSSVIRKT